MLTIEERSSNADMCIADIKQRQRLEQRREREAQEKTDQRRNFIIGELVTKYFLEVRDFEPGTKAENAINFQPLEAFLSVLAADYDLYRELQKQADQLMSEDPDGGWRLPE